MRNDATRCRVFWLILFLIPDLSMLGPAEGAEIHRLNPVACDAQREDWRGHDLDAEAPGALPVSVRDFEVAPERQNGNLSAICAGP